MKKNIIDSIVKHPENNDALNLSKKIYKGIEVLDKTELNLLSRALGVLSEDKTSKLNLESSIEIAAKLIYHENMIRLTKIASQRQ